MKVLILAGGKGSRLSENGLKPMTMIGDKPIIWHIMKWYSKFGFKEFVILGGYKCHLLKEYFHNYYLMNSDITYDLKSDQFVVHRTHTEDWQVTICDTGVECNTAARVKKAYRYVKDDAQFMLTYSDGVSNVDINALIANHNASGKICTLTGFLPNARFGYLEINPDDSITTFIEKYKGKDNFVNGGYFVCNREIFNYISDDETVQFEKGPLVDLASAHQLNCYKHTGFLSPMDTPRDRDELIKLWEGGNAPWKA